MSKVVSVPTDFGFKFGAAEVERTADHNGHVFIAITTDRQKLSIRVTPSGFIRVGEIELCK